MWARVTKSVAAGRQRRGPRAPAACPPGWCVRPWLLGEFAGCRHDEALALRPFALLAFLYRHDDILDDGATVAVRLGDPPSPLPEPVTDLMRAYIQSRQHLPYASSRSSQWLFPGRQPGQLMNPVSLQVHLREIGVPPQRGRASAIRQLVLQAPAPVIAKALGYHDKTATRLV